MPILNPKYYQDMYRDTRDMSDYAVNHSDAAGQLTADLIAMDAQWNYNNAWYDARESASARSAEYSKLGINPLDINRMLLGNPVSDNGSAAPSIGGSDNNSPEAIASAFQKSIASLNETRQQALNDSVAAAQIDNLNSQTAKNAVEASVVNPVAYSQIAKNYSSARKDITGSQVDEAQVGVLNETQKKIIADTALSDAEKRQIEKVISRYDDVTDAQITTWQNQARLYFEQAKTQSNVRANLDANTILQNQETSESMQRTANLVTEQEGQALRNLEQQSITNFVATTGIPLNADDMQTLQYYEKRGEYDKAENYLNTIFDVAANRSSGTTVGQPHSVKVPVLGEIRPNNRPQMYVPQSHSNPNPKAKILW